MCFDVSLSMVPVATQPTRPRCRYQSGEAPSSGAVAGLGNGGLRAAVWCTVSSPAPDVEASWGPPRVVAGAASPRPSGSARARAYASSSSLPPCTLALVSPGIIAPSGCRRPRPPASAPPPIAACTCRPRSAARPGPPCAACSIAEAVRCYLGSTSAALSTLGRSSAVSGCQVTAQAVTPSSVSITAVGVSASTMTSYGLLRRHCALLSSPPEYVKVMGGAVSCMRSLPTEFPWLGLAAPPFL